MRGLKRNEQVFCYCLFDSSTEIEDEYGNATGQREVTYKPPVIMRANISPATGQSKVEMFGDLDDYDKVIVTCDMNCPIAETTVLMIDSPAFMLFTPKDYDGVLTEDGYWFAASGFEDDKHPVYDYIVKRVARSLNSISYAVSKVKVR